MSPHTQSCAHTHTNTRTHTHTHTHTHTILKGGKPLITTGAACSNIKMELCKICMESQTDMIKIDSVTKICGDCKLHILNSNYQITTPETNICDEVNDDDDPSLIDNCGKDFKLNQSFNLPIIIEAVENFKDA